METQSKHVSQTSKRNVSTRTTRCYTHRRATKSCANNTRTRSTSISNDIPPYHLKQECLARSQFDEKFIVKTFLGGECSFSNKIRFYERMFIPINDLYKHWMLLVVDFKEEKFSICDTCPQERVDAYREKFVLKLVDHLEFVLHKWDTNYQKIGISKKFKFVHPT